VTSIYTTYGEEETKNIAFDLAKGLKSGDVIALTGDLGAGKTVFTGGVAEALGVKERVTSPTFTLIHEYQGIIPLFHMDLYRMETLKEIEDIGVEDYLYGNGISLVEWAEKLEHLLPQKYISVKIEHLGGNTRKITIERP